MKCQVKKAIKLKIKHNIVFLIIPCTLNQLYLTKLRLNIKLLLQFVVVLIQRQMEGHREIQNCITCQNQQAYSLKYYAPTQGISCIDYIVSNFNTNQIKLRLSNQINSPSSILLDHALFNYTKSAKRTTVHIYLVKLQCAFQYEMIKRILNTNYY